MKEVLPMACSRCLPDRVRDGIMKSVSEKTMPPSKGDISRALFYIDAAFIFWRRCVSRYPPSTARYMTWDSSPKYRKNCVMVLLRSICRNVLSGLLFTFHALAGVWTCIAAKHNYGKDSRVQGRKSDDKGRGVHDQDIGERGGACCSMCVDRLWRQILRTVVRCVCARVVFGAAHKRRGELHDQR